MLQHTIKIRTLLLFGFVVIASPAILHAQQPATPVKPAVDSSKQEVALASGLIRDVSTGKPVPAISISIPDFSAALTDDNGRFTIKVPNYNATLFVKGEGYQSKEIALKGRSIITASLYEETFNSVYDEAVLPFGEKPLNHTVNAVVSVNTPDAWYRNTESADGLLQGKVAGLQPIMRSGTPNVGASILLRGYNSLYGTNQPLIIVDGMIYDNTDYGRSLIGNHFTNALADIDVRDIENITIVKDGLSTYGTRAANGVILITTSHAKQLDTKIDFGIYGGMNYMPSELPVMKPSDYRTYLSDVLKTRGWTDAQIQAQPYMNDNPSNPDYYRYHNNTDWQKQVMKNSSVNNYYLKVSGGDDIARYALSMGYGTDAGITRGTKVIKYNVRFNSDLNLSRRLSAGTSLSFSYYEQNLKDQGLTPKTNPIFLGLTKAPFEYPKAIDNKGVISPNLADTDTFGISNPTAVVQNVLDDSKVYRFFGSINLKYQLTPYITLKTLGGITVDEVREQIFVPRLGVADDTLSNAVADSRLGSQAKRIFAVFEDTYAQYARTFNRVHKLDIRAGFRYQGTQTQQDIQLGYNSATDDFISVGTGASNLRRVSGNIGNSAWTNAYLSADYALANKYFVSFNTAIDGSSRFGDQYPSTLRASGDDIGSMIPNGVHLIGNNFAIMPSLGLSWLISSEKFMSHVNAIDLLKLRATFSRTGNDDIGDYTAQQSYVSQNLLGAEGLVRGNIANPYLLWETSNKVNLGLDMALFNERLNLSVDVYQNQTRNMITYEQTPAASGYNFDITNGGAMHTTGIDLSVGGRLINTKTIKWDIAVMVASYKNKITRIPGNQALSTFGGATIISQVGAPANIFYGYKTNGVFTTDAEAAAANISKKQADGSLRPFKGGDMRFVDVNKDGVIDDNDRQPIGDPNPDYTGGFSSRLAWKKWSLDVLFTFSKGNQVYNGVRAALEGESNANNQLVSVDNRWRAPGQVTNIPKASWGDPMGNSSFSDRWIEDGSFLRMKTLCLSYTTALKNNFHVKSITFYVTGNNLLTFTKYLGYDPEFQASESILARGVDVGLEPQFRSVIGGLRIGL